MAGRPVELLLLLSLPLCLTDKYGLCVGLLCAILTQHLRMYDPPKFEGDEYEEVSYDDDESEEIVEGFSGKKWSPKHLLNKGKVGHTASICILPCTIVETITCKVKLYEEGHVFPV
uniref:Uncharacterized protein n=1 Tax=Oryza punctata TaxID=4537 RepID=A0A0E0M5N3_ORYPU